MEQLVNDLSRLGMSEIIVCISSTLQVDQAMLEGRLNSAASEPTSVIIKRDERNKGTAGVLKDVEALLSGEDNFCLIHGSVFLNGTKWNEMVASHLQKGPIITSVLLDSFKREDRQEWISLNQDGDILDIQSPHNTKDRRQGDRRTGDRTTGVFLMSCRVFDFLSDSEYLNLKEQAIPRIAETKSAQVSCFYPDPAPLQITSWSEYLNLNRAVLRDWVIAGKPDKTMTNVSPGVWVESGVDIAPSAYVLGPLLIRAGSTIGEGAHVIGPTIIGSNCHVASGSLIRESILWDGATIPKDSRLEYAVVTQEGTYEHGSTPTFQSDFPDDDISKSSGITGTGVDKGQSAYVRVGKRLIDVSLGMLFLVGSLPLMALIALAIKLSDSGPVLFRQIRCGRYGKEFSILKFRTMVPHAESLQNELSAENQVDGPMFKIDVDPRVTKLGRILRKTSLDEFPQLINVLRGEMSLVGPRPLQMKEMAFNPSWRDMRLRVAPGITGLWQLSGQTRISFREWIEHDTQYIRTISLVQDLKILLKTVRVVFTI